MKIDSLFCQVRYLIFSLFDKEFLDCDYVGTMITSEPIAQGFAWRPGQVEFYIVNSGSFYPLEEAYGIYDNFIIALDVFLDEPVSLDKSAVRAIQVPFSVTGNDGIRITSDDDSGARPPRKVAIPAGDYALVFEQGWKYNPQPIEKDPITGEEEEQTLYTLWGRLWFTTEKNAEAKILLKDPRDNGLNIDVDSHLLMDGKLEGVF